MSDSPQRLVIVDDQDAPNHPVAGDITIAFVQSLAEADHQRLAEVFFVPY